MRNKYNTKQKNKILRLVKEYNNSFTVKELYEKLKSEHYNIGLTTIYRKLEDLANKNILKKIYEDNITKYQYLEHCENENHFYLKCDICGNLIHADCECITVFTNHILREHNFRINSDNVIITGICNNCKEKI